MPIRPENRARYPKDWPLISKRIRFERANGRCECAGECGIDHAEEYEKFPSEYILDVRDPELETRFHTPERCIALHDSLHPVTEGRVLLTVAHLQGREIEQCGDDDLKAMCQRCHNRMDAPMRRAGIKERARKKTACGDLFDNA